MSEVLRRKEERRKKRTNAANDDVSTHGSFNMLIYYVLFKINIINLIHFLELLRLVIGIMTSQNYVKLISVLII